MSASSGSYSVAGLIVRILARSTAVLCILALSAFMIPEPGDSFFDGWKLASIDPWMFVFPFGFLFGLLLSLWKDLLGGIIVVGTIAAMYVRFALIGDWLGPAMAFGAIPGVLSLIAWSLTHRHAARLRS